MTVESTAKSKRRKSNKHPEEKDISDRWLLTYADMITLLLGLFIVMYSISTVDAGKLKSVSSVIRGGFGLDEGGDSLVLDGSSGVIKDKDLVPKSQIYRLWERFQYSVKKLLISDKVLIDLQNNEELTLTLPASSLGEGNIKLSKESGCFCFLQAKKNIVKVKKSRIFFFIKSAVNVYVS